MDPVDAILARHGVRGPWRPLAATGVANRIYATDEVVLRVATDYVDAVPDARTESVAAPAARAAGVTTPRLLAFDDSRALVDRPYSLWERVHGETVGSFAPDPRAVPEVWRAVGRELARLHLGVVACPDPHGYLDRPDLGDPRAELDQLPYDLARRVERLLDRLEPAVAVVPPRRFVHDDLHDLNLMCSRAGELLALLDWGDAGWGDPALDFAAMPLAAMPLALASYRALAPGVLGDEAEARILWARLAAAVGDGDDRLAELLALTA